MKDFKTAFGDTVVKSQSANGAEETIKLKGDLTIGGSDLTIGVEVAGPTDLFDCLEHFSEK